MTTEQAFNVLVQGISAANKAGVFDLKDSATLFGAVQTLAQYFEPINNEGETAEGNGPSVVKKEEVPSAVKPKAKK